MELWQSKAGDPGGFPGRLVRSLLLKASGSRLVAGPCYSLSLLRGYSPCQPQRFSHKARDFAREQAKGRDGLVRISTDGSLHQLRIRPRSPAGDVRGAQLPPASGRSEEQQVRRGGKERRWVH
ncbi:glycine amidinotransferase, mitochondrial [Platysternon megacephalum]|uniref:Glycine amidinotransferase, mitochondrial n=1 Tax=Platysternon megacephalum TaxID=55544 RepID=A0A4D9ER30_9SAUR|nr:glycine amidinotransferase, mitochondrial [Platysternon megacephalum]